MIGTRVDTLKVLQVMMRGFSLTMMLISHRHFFTAYLTRNRANKRQSPGLRPAFGGDMATFNNYVQPVL